MEFEVYVLYSRAENVATLMHGATAEDFASTMAYAEENDLDSLSPEVTDVFVYDEVLFPLLVLKSMMLIFSKISRMLLRIFAGYSNPWPCWW